MQSNIGNWTVSIERASYTRDDLAHKYDELSPTWDSTLSRLGFDKAYCGLFMRLKAQGLLDNLAENATVFDAGIGTGALSFAMAAVHNLPLNLHGIDISANMLTQANKNLAKLHIKPTLQTGDAGDLPFENNHFDWVMSAHMLEHLDNPFDGLRELVRVTKSGGKLMIVMTRKSILGNYIDLQWRLNRISEATLISWMTTLGLTDIQAQRLGGPIWSNWMSMVFTAKKV